MIVFGRTALNGLRAFKMVFCRFSKTPPWTLLLPLLEMVVMSLTPPYSAVLLTSLTRISAIEFNEGNSSANGAEVRGPILLMPSILVESMLGFVPTTEMLPLASVWTPGCDVNVESGLVDPADLAVTARG